jgi:cytoskeletal protein CcmA (bactofilin family)
MKAQRFLQPDRHLDQDSKAQDMNDPTSNDADTTAEAASPTAMEVDVGRAMPPPQTANVPTLHDQPPVLTAPVAGTLAVGHSMVADGMSFVGNAWLKGPCSVGGRFEGNLTQAEGLQVAVVVTETGHVKGDITAQKISVMGRTEGVLDSGEGEVALHDTASVHGLVRYGRIQVNGADLNATLERVAVSKQGT